MYLLFLLVFLSCLDLPYPGEVYWQHFFRHSPSSRKAVTPISFLKDSFAGLDTSSFGTWKTFCHLPGRRPALPYCLNRPPLTGRGPLLCDSQWPGLRRAELRQGCAPHRGLLRCVLLGSVVDFHGASCPLPNLRSLQPLPTRVVFISVLPPPSGRGGQARPWPGRVGLLSSQVRALCRSDGPGFFLLLHLAAKSAPKPWLHPPALGFRLGPSFPLRAEAFCCFCASCVFITACWSVCVLGGA